MITNESDPNNDSGPGSFPASPADSVQASPHRPSASLPSAASPFQVSPATLNLIKDFMLKYAQPHQRQAFVSDMLAIVKVSVEEQVAFIESQVKSGD